MGRRARIIGHVADVHGIGWDVKEFRPTDHGFAVAIGWPSGFPRGAGGVGGPRVILTLELADHLESVRSDKRPMAAARLPLGRAQLKSLRHRLEHDRKLDRRAWWVERVGDLQSLTFAEFSARHGVTSSAAEFAYLTLFGRRRGMPRRAH